MTNTNFLRAQTIIERINYREKILKEMTMHPRDQIMVLKFCNSADTKLCRCVPSEELMTEILSSVISEIKLEIEKLKKEFESL